jgi:integrase
MASIRQRTNARGESAYHVQVRLRGYPTETATFERLTDARKWAQSTEAAIREGRHFKTAIAKQKTLGEAIARYFDEVLAHRKNPVNQTLYLTWWKEQLGGYAMASLSTALIVEKRNGLLGAENQFGRKVGTTTTNRYLQALGHVLNIAMNEWEWISENPVGRIKKYKEGRGRVRFLSEEERNSLLRACQQSKNPHLYTIAVLALSTGARKNEILRLKWKDVDFERKRIILNETKNGERRALPLFGRAFDLMQTQQALVEPDCEYVFPSEKTHVDLKTQKTVYQPIDIKRAWQYAIAKAGVQDFRFHDLRHSAASYLAMNGASLVVLANVLGHKTLQMVQRYAHLSEDHTSSMVASMNERIFNDGQVT